MPHVDRRKFLKQTTAAAGAAFVISGTKASGAVLGANDRIRVGVAGIHGQGGGHINAYTKMDGAEVAYLIDPDSRLFEGRIKSIEENGGRRPKTVQDVRQALDDGDVDAISIATPNSWHALITIWACQAGKDVYVEKPCSHNIHEGRIAVETARKYDRIVQHGTQRRSDLNWARVAEIVKKGTYGKLLVSRGLCYKNRPSIGFCADKTPPSELDFNLWLGPARERAYHENLVHYNWHWFWDFGNGDIGNQGVHQMDVARWMIPGAIYPKSVITLGGRLGYIDQGETGNTQVTVMDYGDVQLIFEVRGLPTEGYLGRKVGNTLHFEEGVILENSQFVPKGKDKPEALPSIEAERGPGGGNIGNFIAAVRSRKVSDLNADILEGHYSSALCHLANASLRLGEPARFKPRTRAFGRNEDAIDALERMEEHLTGNGLKLSEMSYRLGRKLTFDGDTEQVVGDPEANSLLTRTCRAPFVVPDRVV